MVSFFVIYLASGVIRSFFLMISLFVVLLTNRVSSFSWIFLLITNIVTDAQLYLQLHSQLHLQLRFQLHLQLVLITDIVTVAPVAHRYCQQRQPLPTTRHRCATLVAWLRRRLPTLWLKDISSSRLRTLQAARLTSFKPSRWDFLFQPSWWDFKPLESFSFKPSNWDF